MTIQIDNRRIRVGWRFILRWPRLISAAADRYPHATIYIGPFPISRW